MKNIAVLAGGYTSERQISLNSGSQILENIDKNLYNAYLVDVRKDGFFCIFNGKEYSVDLNKFAAEIEGKPTKFDYAYLALHGSPGEDGKVQALLDMLGIPYSACDETKYDNSRNIYDITIASIQHIYDIRVVRQP